MRMRRSARTTLCTLAILGLGGSLAAAQDPPPAEESAPKYTQLSNEETLTRWAHVYTPTKIRSLPGRGRVVGKLRYQTEDKLPEVYIALRSTEVKGRTWVEVRIPKRPNGKKGWVREASVGPLQRVTTALVVNRRTLRATLFKKGRKIFTAPVGVGKGSTPTPAGRFWIREKLMLGGGHGVYGPLAFGTSAYSETLSDWPRGGVVGIHGTNQPGLIPGRPSHGCIRMRNGDILRLGRLMPVGTPLRIL